MSPADAALTPGKAIAAESLNINNVHPVTSHPVPYQPPSGTIPLPVRTARPRLLESRPKPGLIGSAGSQP
jgi:hypothetical protein